jgi:DICT domain-containing protein
LSGAVKNFSMFEQALGCVGSSTQIEDLGQVAHVSRRDFDERETFLFRAQAPSVEYLSLLIENALLLRANRAGRVYAGFERLSRLEPIIDRYLRIADLSERLYVFGAPDWTPPRHPHMKLITLDESAQLARECFIIADSSTLHAALIGREEEDDGPRAPLLEERNFRVFKSSHPAIVSEIGAIVEDLIDASLAA